MLINTADALYLGGAAADAAYLGETQVWSPPSTAAEWLIADEVLSMGSANIGDNGNWTLGFEFYVTAPAAVTAIRLARFPNPSPPNHTARSAVWRKSTGAMVAGPYNLTEPTTYDQPAFGGSTMAGWAEATFSPVALEVGVRYLVGAETPHIGYLYAPNKFGAGKPISEDIVRGVAVLPVVDTPQGLYGAGFDVPTSHGNAYYGTDVQIVALSSED